MSPSTSEKTRNIGAKTRGAGPKARGAAGKARGAAGGAAGKAHGKAETNQDAESSLRRLPSVEQVVRRVLSTGDGAARAAVTRVARDVVDRLRGQLSEPAARDLTRETLLEMAVDETEREMTEGARPSLRRVINATGVVLHTNLGRAPLAPEAAAAAATAAGYVNLELNLESGSRRSRQDHIRPLLESLTGAEDALIVNNNAAAVWLVLRGLAAGRPVVISRGELVEIGDSFRLPDIMAEAGVDLVEVGTTNRTTISDYRRALHPPVAGVHRGETAPLWAAPAAVVIVHPSNYRMTGYTARPLRREIVGVAREAGVPVIEDLGSGAFIDLSPWGFDGEPTPVRALSDGVDAVTMSGDKLLGGPQCGIVAGSSAVISPLRADPILRCLRPDKLTLAALEATLRLYLDPDTVPRRLPILSSLTEPEDVVRRRAAKAMRLLKRRLAVAGGLRGPDDPSRNEPQRSESSRGQTEEARPRASGQTGQGPDFLIDVVPAQAEAGGGSLPGRALPTWAIRIEGPGLSPDDLWRTLAGRTPPVVGRRNREGFLLDFRTVTEDEVSLLAKTVADALVEMFGR